VKRWASRNRLERIAPKSEEWVTEGWRLFLRSQEENDEAIQWLVEQKVGYMQRERLAFASIGYETEPYLILFRDQDAFLAKLRWV
jgi:hypothetical protein